MQITLKFVLLIHLLHFLITLNEAKCGKPGQSWDGNNLIAMNPDKHAYYENENVTYSCSGRIYVNDHNRLERTVNSTKKVTKQYIRFCQKDGQWSGAVPKCVNNILKNTFVERIQVYDDLKQKLIYDLNLKYNNRSESEAIPLGIIENVISYYPKGASRLYRRNEALKCLTSGLKSKQKWKFYVNATEQRVMMLDLLVRHDSRFHTNSTFPVVITIRKDENSEPNRICRFYDIQQRYLSSKNNYTVQTFIEKVIQTKDLEKYSSNFSLTSNSLLQLQFICQVKYEYLLERGSPEDPYLSLKAKELPGLITVEFDSNQFDNQITICSYEFYQFSRRCGTPERDSHTIILKNKKSRNNLEDHLVILGCDIGYMIENNNRTIGEVEVRCGIDGDWIENIPRCLPNHTFFINLTENSITGFEANNNKYLLIIVGLLGFMLVVGILYVCINSNKNSRLIADKRCSQKTSGYSFNNYRSSNYISIFNAFSDSQIESYDEINFNGIAESHLSHMTKNFSSCQYDDTQYTQPESCGDDINEKF